MCTDGRTKPDDLGVKNVGIQCISIRGIGYFMRNTQQASYILRAGGMHPASNHYGTALNLLSSHPADLLALGLSWYTQ